MIVCCLFFVYEDNHLFRMQLDVNEKDVAMARDVGSRVQKNRDYEPGMEMLIVGSGRPKEFSKSGKGAWHNIREYIEVCKKKQYSLGTSAFDVKWSQLPVMERFSGLEIKNAPPGRYGEIKTSVEDMPAWPEPDSVAIVQNTIVLKLGNSGEAGGR